MGGHRLAHPNRRAGWFRGQRVRSRMGFDCRMVLWSFWFDEAPLSHNEYLPNQTTNQISETKLMSHRSPSCVSSVDGWRIRNDVKCHCVQEIIIDDLYISHARVLFLPDLFAIFLGCNFHSVSSARGIPVRSKLNSIYKKGFNYSTTAPCQSGFKIYQSQGSRHRMQRHRMKM